MHIKTLALLVILQTILAHPAYVVVYIPLICSANIEAGLARRQGEVPGPVATGTAAPGGTETTTTDAPSVTYEFKSYTDKSLPALINDYRCRISE